MAVAPSQSIPDQVWSPAASSAVSFVPEIVDSDTCEAARVVSPRVNTAAVIVSRRVWMPDVNVIVARAKLP